MNRRVFQHFPTVRIIHPRLPELQSAGIIPQQGRYEILRLMPTVMGLTPNWVKYRALQPSRGRTPQVQSLMLVNVGECR